MESNVINQFTFNFKEVLVDEIALEGLDGIGLDLLWRRVERRINSLVTQKIKVRFWNFIVNCESITFYQLPQPLPYFELRNRFEIIDEESGNLADPDDYLDGPYEACPVDGDYGSSVYYSTRTALSTDKLKRQSYDKIVETYGDTLAMVASIEERWKALAPHVAITRLKELTKNHYFLLELVGKARENGQMTVGKTNLSKVIKEPKLLFYHRKALQDLDLVKTQGIHQVIGSRAVKIILIRLKRFHKPILQSMPKVGKIQNIVQYLLKQPNYTDFAKDMIKKGIFTQSECKKLYKHHNAFAFDNIELPLNKSNKKYKEMTDKIIRLEPMSEESSQSDNETTEEPLKCQYKVKMNLLRQAYERVLESGIEGISQIELSELLGVEFYTSRTICRVFKSRNIVKEIFVDKGKQRIARYIAVVSASTAIDTKYEEEKKKFLEFLNEDKATGTGTSCSNDPMKTESDSEVPNKKLKIDPDQHQAQQLPPLIQDDIIPDSKTIEKRVTELKYLEGYENFDQSLIGQGRGPTLRQLKFANGILKVVREKVVISGYQFLSSLAARAINESPMDIKSLKLLVQKLVSHGQVKLLKMTWPNHQRSCVFFCAPYIQATDPIIKTKYKELNLLALRNKNLRIVRAVAPEIGTRPLSMSIYPRYLKIQKLHEAIMKCVYFNDDEGCISNSPKGFSSLVDIIPEFTLDFALGNMTPNALMAISDVKLPHEMLHQKLRSIPPDLFKLVLTTCNLQMTWRRNLKNLAMLGLVQLIRDPGSTEESYNLTYEFYTHQFAKIIDTKGEWPRTDADKKALEKTYQFQNFQDVENFWSDVYKISKDTKVMVDPSKRCCRKSPISLPVLREEVSLDYGQVLGDGSGPCGFDSSFYMEMHRSWAVCHTKLKQQALLKRSITKISKRKRTKKVQKPKTTVKKCIAKTPTIKPLVCEKKLVDLPQKAKSIKRWSANWSKEEDRMIMLCKAAITIMSPSAAVGCLKLRNIVAKDIISLFDPRKGRNLCHKRAMYLDLNTTLEYEKDCLINELKRYPHLLTKYEDLLKILRIRYIGNMTKFFAVSRLPMMELIWILLQLYQSKSFNKKLPCIAVNLEDFYKNFVICPSTVNRMVNSYKTPIEAGPVLAAIKEGIMLSVMTTFRINQPPEVAQIIHSMFSSFPEQTLRPAIDQLRKCGVVAAKEKILSHAINNIHIRDTVESSYKISTHYQRRWISRLNSNFVDDLMNCIEAELPKSGFRGSPELNCLLFEMKSCEVLDLVSLTVPVIIGSSGSLVQEEQLSVGDMIMKYQLKSGTLSYRNIKNFEKISDLYHIEYEEGLEEIVRKSELQQLYAKVSSLDKIVKHLKEKKEMGSTLKELQTATGYDNSTLIGKLKSLESLNIVKLMGYFENLIVLTEFAKPWTMTVKDKQIIPTPWLTLDMDIRHDVFLKWSGTVMNKVFLNPGCSIAYLSDDCEFLTTRAVQNICMVLEKCNCVTLNVAKDAEPDLFSKDDAIPELGDFNEYESVENILIFPVKDALTRYAILRSKLMEEEPYLEET